MKPMIPVIRGFSPTVQFLHLLSFWLPLVGLVSYRSQTVGIGSGLAWGAIYFLCWWIGMVAFSTLYSLTAEYLPRWMQVPIYRWTRLQLEASITQVHPAMAYPMRVWIELHMDRLFEEGGIKLVRKELIEQVDRQLGALNRLQERVNTIVEANSGIKNVCKNDDAVFDVDSSDS